VDRWPQLCSPVNKKVFDDPGLIAFTNEKQEEADSFAEGNFNLEFLSTDDFYL